MSTTRSSTTVKPNEPRATSVFSKETGHAFIEDDATSDDRRLGALGYKQEFKRDLTILETFVISFSILGILPSIASTISYSLGYSGTGGAIWGWLIAAIIIQSTALGMAELCSSMPTAGGLYYATAVLAPEGWGPVCSWFVGYSKPSVRGSGSRDRESMRTI